MSVAVGTALASGPPHGSVREGLPHTALTSGSCDGQPLVGIRMLSLLAACRTHHKPCDSHPRLCSPASLVLRGRPTPYRRACRPYGLLAFFDRPTLPSRVGVCRASRFSRMELLHMPRVSDSAVSKDRSRLTLSFILPSPYQDTVGTPKW